MRPVAVFCGMLLLLCCSCQQTFQGGLRYYPASEGQGEHLVLFNGRAVSSAVTCVEPGEPYLNLVVTFKPFAGTVPMQILPLSCDIKRVLADGQEV